MATLPKTDAVSGRATGTSDAQYLITGSFAPLKIPSYNFVSFFF